MQRYHPIFSLDLTFRGVRDSQCWDIYLPWISFRARRFRLAPNGEEKALIGHVGQSAPSLRWFRAQFVFHGRPFRVAAHSCVPPTGRARRIETDAGRSARAEGTRRPVACPSNGA